MTSVACALVWLLLAPQAIGEVESRVDKNANFSAYKTYAWRKGHEAFNPDAHKLIVSAIDAQMTGRGLSKVDDDDADVLVTYHLVRAADVDLKMFEQLQKEGKDTAPATKVLGKLAVAVSRAWLGERGVDGARQPSPERRSREVGRGYSPDRCRPVR